MLKSAEDTETDRQIDILEENETKEMPPQLEANKKQHLQHWEDGMHLMFKQQLLCYISFGLDYAWLLKETRKTDCDATKKQKNKKNDFYTFYQDITD